MTIGSLLKTFERELQEAEGLPLPCYDVLIQLSAAPDRWLRMQGLADPVGLRRGCLTRCVDQPGETRRREADQGTLPMIPRYSSSLKARRLSLRMPPADAMARMAAA